MGPFHVASAEPDHNSQPWKRVGARMLMYQRGVGIWGPGHCQRRWPPPRPSLPGDGSPSEWSGVTRVPSGCGCSPSMPPSSLRRAGWQPRSPVHLPRPSPDSCCAFQVVGDKINKPNWRPWLAALGEQGSVRQVVQCGKW